MKQIVHINQHHIKHNRKVEAQDRKPVITCKTYKNNEYHHSIDLVCVESGNILASNSLIHNEINKKLILK